MNVYRTILNTLIEPIANQNPTILHEKIKQLKQGDGESWAIGETIERITRYIGYSLELSDVSDDKTQDVKAWLGIKDA